MLVRFDEGSTGDLDADAEIALVARLRALWPMVGSVVVSDYGYGVLTPRVIAAIAELHGAQPARARGRLQAPDGVPARDVTAVKPNYESAVRLLGIEAGGDTTRASRTSPGSASTPQS